MKKVPLLATTSIASILAVAAIATPAYAWHPKGVITKSVQNQTTGTLMSDANTESAAVSATTGDTLLYTITIENDGTADNNGMNDMANTKMSDTLPAGIELVSDPSQRTIQEDLGTIKPGKSITKTYQVKVTSTTDGDVITNKACFTGNSSANDNPQSGCDVAIVKVKVAAPTPTPTPTPAPTPTPTPTPTTPAAPALPSTGSSALSTGVFVSAATLIGYAINTLRLKFRT